MDDSWGCSLTSLVVTNNLCSSNKLTVKTHTCQIANRCIINLNFVF